MSLPRDIVELEKVLRKNHSVDLFAPTALRELSEISECKSICDRIDSKGLSHPQELMRLCLQALRIQFSALESNLLDAEFVATLPSSFPGIARPTNSVVKEMLKDSESEIIVLGYELSDQPTLELMAEASTRGVNIFIICDRERNVATQILENWPDSVSVPRIFQDMPQSDGAPYASMHAKCLLVDGSDLLVTSANFTFHGLHGNIEVGIRLSGAPAAEARKIFSHLVTNQFVCEIE